jgi:hypothetical protein
VRKRILLGLLALAAIAAALLPLARGGGFVPFRSAAVHDAAASDTAAPPRIFAYYYLWWSARHWRDKLGSAYPYDASPLPLPAKEDDYTGCNPVSLYAGNQLTDVPQSLYTQDDPSVVEAAVRSAAAAGLSGFIVNWRGDGTATQTLTSGTYNQRLQAVFDAVHEVNAEGTPFKLWLSYKASDTLLGADYIANDLAYLQSMYAKDPALDRSFGARPVLIWNGSRKYPAATIQAVSNQFRSTFFLVGDENWNTWSDVDAANLDGDQYYWSSQNPYTNPSSFSQLQNLAAMVRGSGGNPDGSAKAWFAPLAPGFDAQLLTGSTTCVPRNGGDTMRKLYAGNSASNPDAWVLISWNEVAEGTYVEPLQRWGNLYLDTIRSIVGP